MERPTRSGPRCYYKGSYFLAFYSITDETLLYTFDNIREILKFQDKECSRANIQYVKLLLYRALKRESHITSLLTGKKMRVYMININDDIEEE